MGKYGYQGVGICSAELKTIGVWKSDVKESFERGVVFYMKEDAIVGIMMWNIPGKIDVAKRLVKQGKKYENKTELVSLFNVHA